MKLKRLLSGALAAAVALSTMALTPFTTASAVDVVATGQCGDNVNWSLDSDGVLTISGTGSMYNSCTSMSDFDYGSYSSQIKEVVFGEGVTMVGANAFNRCTTLEKVTFSSTVTRISDTTFRYCSSLTSVEIPANCSFGSASFRNCTGLETVYMGDDITTIPDRTFGTCTALKDVYIYSLTLSTVTAAGGTTATFDTSNNPTFHVYAGSTTETTLINAGYTNIEYLASSADFTLLIQALTDAKAYDSDEHTEESYKALTDAVAAGNEVLSNENATQDEVDAAAQAINDAIAALVEITVVTGQCGENVTWSLDKTTGILTISGTGDMYGNVNDYATYTAWTYSKYADVIKEAVIEEGVTSVGPCAFGHIDNVTTGVSAYPNLTKITMPSTIEVIGKAAFEDSIIENLTVPENVTNIGAFAYNRSKIETVNLNEGIGLGGNAFAYCNSLKEVTIPAGITYRRDANWTGDNGSQLPFTGCESLEKVTVLGGGTNIQRFEQYENALADGMFERCKALKEVIIKCDDLAYVAKADSSSEWTSETFETLGTNVTYTVIKGSTTEKTLRDAGYITDENVVYSIDLTELNAKLAEAEALVAENYTADSYAALTAAIGTAKTVKANKDAAQADIDSAAKAVADAINALVVADKSVIKAALEELAGNIEKLLTVKDESSYTADSWTALNEALKAAQEALASEEELTYSGYAAVYDNLSGAYTGLTTASTSDSEYVSTIYGGYEVTYNHETDSYKIVVSDDVDMDKVVGTTYVKITLTPNTADLQYQLAYGTINIWNFLNDLQKYGQYADGNALSGTDDTVIKYNLSIPSAESAFSLTAGTGWTKDTEVFYVKNVEFYNANDELLYTYSADSIGVGDVRDLETLIEKAEALNMSDYTEESAALLKLVLEEAKATLSDPTATKDDYRVQISELEAAINELEAIEYQPADYTAVKKAIMSFPNGVSFSEESLKVYTDACNAVVYDLDISHQAEVDAWAKAIEDAIAGLEIVDTRTPLAGKIYVSDEESGTEMTVTAVAADGTKTSVTATSMGTYVFENLEVGDYTLTVSGGKYAERTYEITVKASDNTQDVKLNPYGDINGDGKVTTADVGMANSHAKGVKTLTDYDFACGDVNRDGSITTADVGMINSHAKGVKSLW